MLTRVRFQTADHAHANEASALNGLAIGARSAFYELQVSIASLAACTNGGYPLAAARSACWVLSPLRHVSLALTWH